MKKLPTLPPTHPEFTQSCDFMPHRCTSCELYQSRCHGCIPSGRRITGTLHYCIQGGCSTGCNTCGGGRGVDVPTLCCKSPLKYEIVPDILDWSEPGALNDLVSSAYSKTPPIDVGNSVIVIQGRSGYDSPYPENTKAVAITLRHIWAQRKGFYSKDLKDYLSIPDDVKLILLSSVKDDFLELYAEHELHGPFDEFGVDYWMPLAFSTYRQKGNMSNFFDTLRTLRSLKEGGGHFVPVGVRHGLYVRDLYQAAISSVQNVIINCQFLISTEEFKAKLKEILYWDAIAPKSVPFFLIGSSSVRSIWTIKRFIPDRKITFLSVTPWITAGYGKLYDVDSRDKKSTLPKDELLVRNQENYARICNHDLSGSPLHKKEAEWKAKIQREAQCK